MEEQYTIDLTTCRICLLKKKPLNPLFKYHLAGNYAEMLTAIADVKVSSDDGLPDKICTKCCTGLENAYRIKLLAERSERKLRKMIQKLNEITPKKKIAFDSFIDIKKEIEPLAIKCEPKWEMEIEVLDEIIKQPMTTEQKDIVIANTVIRKVGANTEDSKAHIKKNLLSNSNKENNDQDSCDVDYLDDNYLDDDDDDEYVPPAEKSKPKFKKPRLCNIKVFKDKKTIVKRVKVLGKIKMDGEDGKNGDSKSTTITCYPITQNGLRGAPILLKRPKDSTVLKISPKYKQKNRTNMERIVRVSREKEKLVCPVCGILTYTLGNHMSTHQEKKKYACSQCNKTFAQKGNLDVHMKQHTGVKDQICEVCGASFYTQKSLLRHNLIHKGERPHSCELCNKKFIARCDLNRHLRIHYGYKPFKCGTCAMSFNAKHQLQNHERMHTGERPYTCQVCNVAFSYKVNLNNHVSKVHGVNLKFKSIHTVTEEILRREISQMNEAQMAIYEMNKVSDITE